MSTPLPIPSPSSTPFPIEIISNTPPEWWTPFITPAGALLGAALGGAIAFITVRASDKRKASADDRRQWASRLLEVHVALTVASKPFYDTRQHNIGDTRHLAPLVPQLTASLESMELQKEILEMIAPSCVPAAKALVDAATRARDDADNGSPLVGTSYTAFEDARKAVTMAFQERANIDAGKKPATKRAP